MLIDLPGLTNNVTYNGLWAARHVIAPVEMGPFEAEQTAALQRDLTKIADNFAVEIELTLVLPNKVDTRTNLAETYLTVFKEDYSTTIVAEYIPYSQDIRNAADQGQTAFALETPSNTAQRAREGYLDAATTLIDHLGGADND